MPKTPRHCATSLNCLTPFVNSTRGGAGLRPAKVAKPCLPDIARDAHAKLAHLQRPPPDGSTDAPAHRPLPRPRPMKGEKPDPAERGNGSETCPERQGPEATHNSATQHYVEWRSCGLPRGCHMSYVIWPRRYAKPQAASSAPTDLESNGLTPAAKPRGLSARSARSRSLHAKHRTLPWSNAGARRPMSASPPAQTP